MSQRIDQNIMNIEVVLIAFIKVFVFSVVFSLLGTFIVILILYNSQTEEEKDRWRKP